MAVAFVAVAAGFVIRKRQSDAFGAGQGQEHQDHKGQHRSPPALERQQG